jgi:prevent-host-death family protein
MSVVNMHQAKSQLSKLVEQIEAGSEQEIIIARNGKPAARLVPIAPKKQGVRLGIAEGLYPKFDYEAFKALDKEIEQLFLGEELTSDR